MSIQRKNTREIKIGKIAIGSNNPIAVQSMLNATHNNFDLLLKQTIDLKNAGADIVRMAVMDMDAVYAAARLKEKVDISLVADIHFDYKLAIESANAGVDKIRINPGNIGDDSRVKAVSDICKLKNIPIRIGVNSGSLEKHILNKYSHPCAAALCESALYHASLLEKFDFNNIVLSVKSSNVNEMIEANTLLSDKCDYPLHLGVTEAGCEYSGIIKSSVGIGSLLTSGIGDTIRVSLTADPVSEIKAAKEILKSIGYIGNCIEFVSCPTCGRTNIDLITLANSAYERLSNIQKPIKVAIMGCVVNGPGEAREADIGIAGGKGEGLIFKKGKIIKKVPEDRLLNELMNEIEKM